MKGLISRIEGTRIEDGPGIRTTVFMKGCPLKCPWCHNPESMAPGQELSFVARRCDNCGDCISACPEDALRLKRKRLRVLWNRCNNCLLCVESCLSGALRPTGRWYASSELFEVVSVDAPFYHYSNGGVTFSGGEPLHQAEFLVESLMLLKSAGIQTAVQTAGLCNSTVFRTITELTDFVMYDLKIIDEFNHRRFLGGGNEVVFENLLLLAEIEKRFEVRMPLVKGYTDDDENLIGIAEFLRGVGVETVKILLYHGFGVSKTDWVSHKHIDRNIESLSPEDISRASGIFEQFGVKPYVEGELYLKQPHGRLAAL